jgi:hypothetical protein
MLRERKYIGEGYGIAEWCPSIVDTSTFELANSLLYTQKKSGGEARIYLFSGLGFCALCGSRMSVYAKASGSKEFIYYRCPRHQGGRCTMGKQTEETRIENALIRAIESKEITPLARISAPTPQSAERQKKKLGRLNDLYVSGFIEKSEYEAERKRLVEEKSLSPIISDISDISREDYINGKLERAEKKAFWSRTLEHFELSDDDGIRAFFYQSGRTQPSGTATTITVSASINARRRF